MADERCRPHVVGSHADEAIRGMVARWRDRGKAGSVSRSGTTTQYGYKQGAP